MMAVCDGQFEFFFVNLIRKCSDDFVNCQQFVRNTPTFKISYHLISFFCVEQVGRPVLRSVVLKTAVAPKLRNENCRQWL
jgi:hypothetical protein